MPVRATALGGSRHPNAQPALAPDGLFCHLRDYNIQGLAV